VVLADINNDSKPDLIVANPAFSGGSVSYLLGNGDGTFQAAAIIATGNYSVVAAGDVNLDGNVDLVALGTFLSPTVFLGNGNGTFQTGATYAAGSTPNSIVIRDITGDGKPDLVIGLTSGIGTLVGNGDGTFQTATEYVSGGDSGHVFLGNFNHDLRPDAAVANGLTFNVSLFLNSGSGKFLAARQFAVSGFQSQNSIGGVTGDFNGDGKKDIAVVSDTPGVHVLLGNGDGTFQSEIVTIAGFNPQGLATGDFNRDHKLDLVVTDATAEQVLILLGNGDGTFQVANTYPAPCDCGPVGVAVADVNHDGKLDVLAAIEQPNDPNRNFLEVYLGNGDGSLQPGVGYPVGIDALNVTLGDINNDGNLDAIVGAYTTTQFLSA
jgi:hypothetical protein